MSETRDIILGGKTYAVPRLPLRLSMRAYPLCRKLTNAQIIERAVEARGALECTEAEMADLAELAFIAAAAAEPGLGRDDFDGMAITPPELLDAFFAIRYQTGGWIPAEPQEGQDPKGEGKGARKPRRSTSAAS